VIIGSTIFHPGIHGIPTPMADANFWIRADRRDDHRGRESSHDDRAGVLTYSALVSLYLVYLGFTGGLIGILLWPVVALHLVLTALFGSAINKKFRD
jgi:hypothetical protein